MPTPNILFICSLAEVRSPCAASLINDSKFAGTSPASSVSITQTAINWADIICCMEQSHKEELIEKFPFAIAKDIIVLNISADYSECNSELKEILKRQLSKKGLISN